MKFKINLLMFLLVFLTTLSSLMAQGQSPSFTTYTNPIIPGDHPDPTMTKVGNYYYTTGSSFNPTPVIYRSTDMVHWEVVAQTIASDWSSYEDKPAGGIWGSHLVFYNSKYWVFFGHWGTTYFTSAASPQGPWSAPVQLNKPSSVPSLGQDNSIFIDDDNKWYLLVKAGQAYNWIVELGLNGQPSGQILDLTWLNPAPNYPYGYAEGPVMRKYHGNYYYYCSQSAGEQEFIFKSKVLSANQSDWTEIGSLLSSSTRNASYFQQSAHNSEPIPLADSTYWIVSHSWLQNNGDNQWSGQGRQGVLSQITWNSSGVPSGEYPVNLSRPAPNLLSGGIPWMVPKSDFFNSTILNPEWSLLGQTPKTSYSVTQRPGWLRLTPSSTKLTPSVIKNDGEHAYSLITKVDFSPTGLAHEAGLRVITGNEDLFVKLYSSYNNGKNVIRLTFNTTSYEIENTAGSVVWLKLQRETHIIKGYFSADGITWSQVGSEIDVTSLDKDQHDYNSWTGNRQGLYVKGKAADFDFYIYRDAYSNMLADCPANSYGTKRTSSGLTVSGVLDNIQNNDWAMYAGVEFGTSEYNRISDSLQIVASSAAAGGNVEVWLDSIDTGNKIGTCPISSTGSLTTFKTFTTKVNPTKGRHDVYLRFTGSGTNNLFQLKGLQFTASIDTTISSIKVGDTNLANSISIYPNPATNEMHIKSEFEFNSLGVFNLEGKQVIDKKFNKNITTTTVQLNLSKGVYIVKIGSVKGIISSKIIVN